MSELKLDSQSVLGVFLPNVYINTVTLERSIGSPPKREGRLGPHIWDPVFNPVTKKWEEPSGVPTLQAMQEAIANVDYTDSNTSNTIVTLNLTLKEKVAPDSELTFLFKEEIWKYLKIRVIQSPFQVATKQLILKPKTFFTPSSGLFKVPPDASDVVGQGGRNLFQTNAAMGIAQMIVEHCQVVDIAVPDIASGLPNKVFTNLMEGTSNTNKTSDFDLTGFDQFVTEVDSIGNKIYSIPFTVKFEVKRPTFAWEKFAKSGQTGGFGWPTNKPHHLAYFAAAYLDFEEVALKEGFEDLEIPQEIISDLSLGKVTSDTIISNGSVASHGTILLDQQGAIWSGDVHKMPDGRMMKGHKHEISLTPTGAVDYNEMQSKYLTAKIVPFSKVQDFREVQDISKLEFNFNEAVEDPEIGLNVNMLLNKFLSPPTPEIVKQQKSKIGHKWDLYNIAKLKGETPLFSDLHLSLNRNSSASFVFTVNFAEMVKKNSAFPKLVTLLEKSDKAEFKNLLKKARIAEMSIKSRRVKENLSGQNGLGTLAEPRPYTDNEKPITIAINSELNTTNKPAISGKTFIEKREPHFGMPFLPPDLESPYLYRGAIREEDLELRLNAAPGKSLWPAIRSFTGVDWTVGRVRKWTHPETLNTPTPGEGGHLQWDRAEHVLEDKRKTGVYQYAVEMEVFDPTVAYMAEKLSELKQVLYGTETIMGFKEYYEDSKRDPQFFNQYLNRFTKKFDDYITSDPGRMITTVERDELGRATNLVEKQKQYKHNLLTKLVKFVSIFGSLAGISNDKKKTFIATNLWKYCNPKSGSIKGIEVVVHLMETVVTQIEQSVDNVLNTNKSKTKLPNIDVVEGSLKSANISFKIEHYFSETFDARQPAYVGLDYLSITDNEISGFEDTIFGTGTGLGDQIVDPISNTWGPRTIHPNRLWQRSKLELDKYFPNSDINDINFSVKLGATSDFEKTFASPNPNAEETIFKNLSLHGERFSFLSPSYIKHSSTWPGVFNNLNDSPIGDVDLKTAILNIMAHNKARSRGKEAELQFYDQIPVDKDPPLKLSKKKQVLRANLLSFAGTEGCTVQLVGQEIVPGKTLPPPGESDESGFKDILTEKEEIRINSEYLVSTLFYTDVDPNDFLFSLMFTENFDLDKFGKQMRTYDLKSMLEEHALRSAYYYWKGLQVYKDWKGVGVGFVHDAAAAILNFQLVSTAPGAYTSGHGNALASSAHPISRLPLQIKSLVIGASTNTTPNTSATADNWAAKWAKYKNLVRVEKLTGYGLTKDGKINLKAPHWDPLRPLDLTEVTYVPDKTLCRLRRWTDPVLSEFNELLELPINDGHFLTSRFSMKETIHTGPYQVGETIVSGVYSDAGLLAAKMAAAQGIVSPGTTEAGLLYGETSKGYTLPGGSSYQAEAEEEMKAEEDVMDLAPPESTSTNNVVPTEEEESEGAAKKYQEVECPEGQRAVNTPDGVICVEETEPTHEDKGGGQMDKGSTY